MAIEALFGLTGSAETWLVIFSPVWLPLAFGAVGDLRRYLPRPNSPDALRG